MPLTLAVGLGMKTRHQLDSGARCSTELSPDLEYKLGSSVQEYLSGDSLQSEDMVEEELGGLSGGRQPG